MSTLLHQFIKAHLERAFPDTDIRLAPSPDEEWIAVIDGMAFAATVGGDSEVLIFTTIDKSINEIGIHVNLTADEWALINAAAENPFDRLPQVMREDLLAEACLDLTQQPMMYAGRIMHGMDQYEVDTDVIAWGLRMWDLHVAKPDVRKALRDACERRLPPNVCACGCEDDGSDAYKLLQRLILHPKHTKDDPMGQPSPPLQEQDQPSHAWQLLEVANDELANDLIEHYNLGSELIDIDANRILDLIAKRMVGQSK